jgi:hypothetical protein
MANVLGGIKNKVDEVRNYINVELTDTTKLSYNLFTGKLKSEKKYLLF